MGGSLKENYLNELTAFAAHEVKNPLSIIRANLQLLELDCDIRYKNNFGVMYKEIDKINNLMIELISLTKKTEYNKTKINTEEIISDIVNSFSAESLTKNIKIEFEKNEIPIFIYADYEKIKQVIVNIIKNSFEAVEENSGRIVIKIACKEKSVFITIEDNGKGITRENLIKIGKNFFTTKSGGSGLGICICKKIVEENGGKLKIKSREGKGTCVSLCFDRVFK